MDEKIMVLDEDGNEVEIEQIADIHLDSTNKDYLIYTKNEQIGEGIRVYASEVNEDENGINLLAINDENEMKEIKKKIADIVKGGNN